MERFHTAFIEKYGSVTDYFYGIGFSEEEVNELSQLMIA